MPGFWLKYLEGAKAKTKKPSGSLKRRELRCLKESKRDEKAKPHSQNRLERTQFASRLMWKTTCVARRKHYKEGPVTGMANMSGTATPRIGQSRPKNSMKKEKKKIEKSQRERKKERRKAPAVHQELFPGNTVRRPTHLLGRPRRT